MHLVSPQGRSYHSSGCATRAGEKPGTVDFTNNGAIVVFLCSNLGNGPAGTQACPAAGGTIQGVIRGADVGAGAVDQGIDAGEFQELLRAIRAGATYVNVHSVGHPGGEIRAQLG